MALGQLDMFSLSVIAVAVAESVLFVWLSWRFSRWSVIQLPPKRSRTFCAAALFLLFSLFPAIYIIDGLSSEEVTHFRRLGPNITYAFSQKPDLYWVTITLAYSMFMFFFVFAVYLVVAAIRNSSRPNKPLQPIARRTRSG
jgi:hypothetical protein